MRTDLHIAHDRASAATKEAFAVSESARNKASGRALHIADLVAAGLPVEGHWIEGYVQARDEAREADVAYEAAFRASSAAYEALRSTWAVSA